MDLRNGFKIADISVYPGQGCLLTPAGEVLLRDDAMAVLLELATIAPSPIGRQQLIEKLGGEQEFSHEALQRCLEDLSQVLGDGDSPLLGVISADEVCLFADPEPLPELAYVPVAEPMSPAEPATAAESTAPVAEPSVPVASLSDNRIGPAPFVAVILLGAVMAAVLWLSPDAGLSGPQYSASLAVLPFETVGAEQEDLLGPGIAEDILNSLARAESLLVYSRHSTFSEHQPQDHGDAGHDGSAIVRHLGADYMLTGSLLRQDDSLTLSVRLIDSASDETLWSESYADGQENLIAVRDVIVSAVLNSLELPPVEVQPGVSSLHPSTYTTFVQAVQYSHRGTPEYLLHGAALYEQVLLENPENPAALAGLGENLRRLTELGVGNPHGGYSRARTAAQKALDINPHHAPAILTLGRVAIDYRGDIENGVGYIRRALELAPNNEQILRSAAVMAFSVGQTDKAIEMGRHLARRDPLNPQIHANLGLFYLFASRYTESIAAYRQVLVLDPHYVGAHYEIGLAQLLLGNPVEALNEFTEEPDPEWRTKGMALALHDMDSPADHLRALNQLIAGWGEDWPSEVAHVYAWAGDKDAAFQWLNKAIDAEQEGLSTQFQRPLLRSLHDDPRWDTFLERSFTAPHHLADLSL